MSVILQVQGIYAGDRGALFFIGSRHADLVNTLPRSAYVHNKKQEI